MTAFRMVALDQRPPLFEAIDQAKGIARDQFEYADMTAAKRLLVEALAPHCSSMLFDPNFAVPAAIDLLPARCGLIMTLEEHRVDETPGGRKSRAIANWSVEKIRAIGGDAVKVLAWYRPDADPVINEHQKRFLREIGEDCARFDIPYVLELMVYPLLGSANHTADDVESPGKLPQLVIESVGEFAKADYGVDLLKLESPLTANNLPTSDASAGAQAAQSEFDAVGEICEARRIPWVLFSGGAAPEKFERVLDYACATGGFSGRPHHLARRGAPVFSGSQRGRCQFAKGRRRRSRTPQRTDQGRRQPLDRVFSRVQRHQAGGRFRAVPPGLSSHRAVPVTLWISDLRHQASGSGEGDPRKQKSSFWLPS
jgi:tagatose 1,6-diphosphate aldolase